MRNLCLRENFKRYILDNHKEYILVSLIFLIGLFVGILVVNNSSIDKLTETSEYINSFIQKFKETNNIDKSSIIAYSLKNNFILAVVLWLAGTTVIGIPIVLFMILFRGFSLGLTISLISFTLGRLKGILFCLISIFIQNLLFIPAIITLGVSSIKLYKSIVSDRKKEKIKTAVMKHTAISIMMTVILVLSSILESLVSTEVLKNYIKYF